MTDTPTPLSAILLSGPHGDWCEQTIRPTEHADSDSTFIHNPRCRDSRLDAEREARPDAEEHHFDAACEECRLRARGYTGG